MYKILLEAHSGFRYIVFILMLLALIQSITGLFGNKPYTEGNRKINLFTLIASHIQLTIGLVLYFFSPFAQPGNMAQAMKDASLRYWTVEHITMMIIAVILITIGHSKSKKATLAVSKHKNIAIFYSIATILIVIAIVYSGRPLIGV